MRFANYVILLGGAVSFLAGTALAQSPGAVYVAANDLRAVSSGSSSYTCAQLAGSWQSGAIDRKNPSYFLSYKTQLAAVKKSLKKASGSKRTKLNAKLLVLKAKSKRAQAACNSFNGGGTQATPTPTSSGNFDANGNVTALGKSIFGIPANLSASISAGKNLHNVLCSGCHGDELGRSFSSYRSEISKSPMSFTISDVPDTDLANLTAYLNRFRP